MDSETLNPMAMHHEKGAAERVRGCGMCDERRGDEKAKSRKAAQNVGHQAGQSALDAETHGRTAPAPLFLGVSGCLGSSLTSCLGACVRVSVVKSNKGTDNGFFGC